MNNFEFDSFAIEGLRFLTFSALFLTGCVVAAVILFVWVV
jgi:hypothetical protein